MSLEIKIGSIDALEEIRRQMGEFQWKAPNVLQNAVNQTATYAKKRISKAVLERYALRPDKRKLVAQKQLYITRADKRKGKYTAELHARSGMTSLSYFDIAPRPRGGPVYARVLVKNAMKRMYGTKPNPFSATFDSGHNAVVKRVIGTEYRENKTGAKNSNKRDIRTANGLDITALHEFMGPSAASMFKGAHDFTPNLSRDIARTLTTAIEVQTKKMIAKAKEEKWER